MEVRDYKDAGPLSDGILSGLGVSFLAHLAVFVLVLLAPWAFPSREIPVSFCRVSLLAGPGMGSGSAPGEEGARGSGSPEPAGNAETIRTLPEPQKPEPAPVQEVVEDAAPLAPIRKTVEKHVEKPKLKSKPRPVAEPPRAQQRTATAETSSSIVSKATGESTDSAHGPNGGNGEGNGPGNADGAGKGNSGDGPGAGSGVGSGSGGGLFDTSFGSGDGPKFDNKALPKYPRLARELGKEGIVLLRVTIDERGRLAEVEILKQAGSGFDEEAVKAVRNSSFCPAKRNGKPVPCRAHLPIRFVLTGSERK